MAPALRAALLAAAILATCAPAAFGAEVSSQVQPGFCHRDACTPDVLVARYAAAPGEANRVTVRTEADGTVVLEDRAAPVENRSACRTRSEHAVACPRDVRLSVVLLDGDDTATVDGDGVDVAGGDGDDQLRAERGAAALDGGSGRDVVTGGPGADRLTGGPGSDDVRGGAGVDVLVDADGTPAADAYDGGDGVDRVDYEGRTQPLSVDLADAAPDGAAGEGDRLAAVEGAVGGSADDRLTGTSGPNRLEGGPGRDVLAGAGGHDFVFGGEASDRIDGGPGDDQVQPGPAADVVALGRGDDFVGYVESGDRVDAGPGDDRVGLSDAGPRARFACGAGHDVVEPYNSLGAVIPDDCETVRSPEESGQVRLATPVRSLAAVVARLTFRCGEGLDADCRLRIRLRRALGGLRRGPILGSRTVRAREGRTVRGAGVRLSPAGRRLLRRGGRLRVWVVVRVKTIADDYEDLAFLVRLRAPG